jgi:hypothetical protein
MQEPLRIGVLGATGYVGSRFVEMARNAGHAVVPFSRRQRAGFREAGGDGRLDFSGLDAVVNFAGEPILGLWTPAKKREILRSRVETTRRVVQSLGPEQRVLVNASAVGFYGDTGDKPADESSLAGKGFLAEVCRAWEGEAAAADSKGVRTVLLRIGFVTGPGGAMRLVLPLFKLGLGGRLGSGRQWMPCIHVDDVAGMALWALENESVRGPLNAVGPEPARNLDFTKTLASAVRRPAVFPAPAFLLRLALGGLSHVMLDSIRAVPAAALRGGYAFRYPTLEANLQAAAAGR